MPPGTGIVHQVNIEYLARVTMTREVDGVLQAYPDTCVGTDSHTTMVNGLGVLGWGVGGIEAEAAMLGQPVSMLIPKVVGFKLTGTIPAGVTATDVVLTITQMLRKHGVVGKFVEFYGAGVAAVPLANRATIGNMSPEFGSTAAMFPIDDVTLDYLRLTGRSEKQVALVEAYAKEQGLWHDPSVEPVFSEYLELDLSTVVPSIAGPKRPQDRIELSRAKAQFELDLNDYASAPISLVDAAIEGTFPASDPIGLTPQDEQSAHVRSYESGAEHHASHSPKANSQPTPVALADGREFTLDHGAVAIAAITSCTNTSNPSVMLAAGLLARNASKKGLKSKPWVKTTLAPGSKVVTDYYEKAGLTGRTSRSSASTSSATAAPPASATPARSIDEISAAVNQNDLAVTAVLSGNRNFEGRINPDVKMNYLASPPLVIAYALAGSMNFDFEKDAAGQGHRRQRRLPEGHLARRRRGAEDHRLVDRHRHVHPRVRGRLRRRRALAFAAHPDRRHLRVGRRKSTYVRKPPYFDGMTIETTPVTDIAGARVLAKLGDSVTTDHISPAGSIKADSPAGQYLDRARRRPQGLQLLRLAPRQPRGHDPRHVREHPPQEPAAGRRRGRLHPRLHPAGRPAVVHLRRAAQNYQAAGHPARDLRPARSTAPARPATGRPRAPACSASRRSSPRASSASTART